MPWCIFIWPVATPWRLSRDHSLFCSMLAFVPQRGVSCTLAWRLFRKDSPHLTSPPWELCQLLMPWCILIWPVATPWRLLRDHFLFEQCWASCLRGGWSVRLQAFQKSLTSPYLHGSYVKCRWRPFVYYSNVKHWSHALAHFHLAGRDPMAAYTRPLLLFISKPKRWAACLLAGLSERIHFTSMGAMSAVVANPALGHFQLAGRDPMVVFPRPRFVLYNSFSCLHLFREIATITEPRMVLKGTSCMHVLYTFGESICARICSTRDQWNTF